MTHNTRDYQKLMRERGFRVTPQRRIILDAICEGNGHTALEEIYARVQAHSPTINLATVYRTLDFLCGLGLVVAVDIGGRTVYEIAGEAPHHHLICRGCGQVQQISHADVLAFLEQIGQANDFQVEMNHLALFGLCAACRPAAGAIPAPTVDSKPRRRYNHHHS